MIRGSLGILLIVLSLSLSFLPPVQHVTAKSNLSARVQLTPLNDPYNPSCPCPAFNVTYSQFDIYTSKNATTAPPNLTFFSTINNTQTGQPVSDTAFKYSIGSSSAVSQSINYSLTVPKGPGPTTFLKFDWNGTIGQGTSARYLVYNATKPLQPVLELNVTRVGPPYSFNFTGGPPLNATGGVPISCGIADECYDITRLIGSKLNLAFMFNSNSTGKGLKIQVANIEVASVGNVPNESTSHTMKLIPLSQVSHNATASVTYNATATNAKHLWGQTVTTYYFPKSYTLTSISLNNTISLSLAYPIAQGTCSVSSCSGSQVAALKNMQFISLNDTTTPSFTSYPWFRGTAVILAMGASGEASVQTTLGGVPTEFWVPGDTMQVRVSDTQGVNVTGSNTVSILSPSAPFTNLTQAFSAPSRGIFLFNFTSILPQAPLGPNWNVTSVFFNNFDYGIAFHLFRVEQIQVNQGSFGYSGDNRRLTISGTLAYGSNSTVKPGSIIGNVVAVDSGSVPAPLTTSVLSSSLGKGMYVSNVTVLNGVFTSGEPLIATFTLVNPTGLRENATITLEHEWLTQQTHGASITFNPPPGDVPYYPSTTFVYRLNATLTLGGIRAVVTSLTSGNSITVNIPAGTPPVTSVRQHSGLFKITVTSTTLSAPSVCGTPACANSLESSTYAYLLVNPPLPSRFLASALITMQSGGAFTASMTSGGELGARKLVFFVLGQDPNGITITTQDKSTPESTILQATIDNVPTATQGQSMAITLHLTSNSTILNMNITIGLNIDGQLIQSQPSVYILHGSKKDVIFNFNAPSALGVHTFTFFSADYGAPLITGTIQVSLLQSSLQVILPAIIGLAAAIVILLFFMFRKKPKVVSESSAKDKPTVGKPKPNPGSSSAKSLT